MDVTVIKRDNTKESFDPETLMRVVIAAGLTPEEAKKVSEGIENWLTQRGKPEVTSVQIRDQIIVEIQKLNKNVARSFIDYEKYRDKNLEIAS